MTLNLPEKSKRFLKTKVILGVLIALALLLTPEKKKSFDVSEGLVSALYGVQ